MVYCKNRRFTMCLGIPGKILDIVDEDNSIAKVDVSGVKRNVNVALVRPEGIAPGDWVLIHVGFAMSKIDEEEARETQKALQLMGQAYADELNMLHSSQIEGRGDWLTVDKGEPILVAQVRRLVARG